MSQSPSNINLLDEEENEILMTLDKDSIYQTNLKNPVVEDNQYRFMEPESESIPIFKRVRDKLPKPHWENHQKAIDCYWKVWKTAFQNIWEPSKANDFVAPYIDTAFNHRLFMWDTVFILFFAKYGRRVFNFQRTLDNFYAKQHPDGWICREIKETDGEDSFTKFNPSGTGPNILPWIEWEYFKKTRDVNRLEKVFPALVGYHRWFRLHRTWPDGSYWNTGWGSGMDNQPRLCDGRLKTIKEKFGPLGEAWYHDHMVWSDTCIQQYYSAKILLRMGEFLGQKSDLRDMKREKKTLQNIINERLWDEDENFYFDELRNGNLSDVKSVGAYWTLIAGLVPEDNLDRFISHLEDESEFNRTHRVPSLSADHPDYDESGNYWCGGVWPPTNYMVLRGLSSVGKNELAHKIAMNHLFNVYKVFEDTGTVWENYAPESSSPGEPAKRDFVGWGGIGPVAELFEYAFGLKSDVQNKTLTWNIRLTDSHGVENYPFGEKGVLDLYCESRSSQVEEPKIEASSNIPLQLEIQWAKGSKTIDLG